MSWCLREYLKRGVVCCCCAVAVLLLGRPWRSTLSACGSTKLIGKPTGASLLAFSAFVPLSVCCGVVI